MTLPPPRQGGVYVVAHRGVHQGIPENTIPAFRKAIELGCDYVEIDVRTTKDGHFVIMHNATIDAYFPGHSGRVDEMTLAEMRQLSFGKRYGSKWEQTTIPTFEQVLILCKGKIGIYLDLKSAPVAELVKLIRKHEMEKSVLWYGSPHHLGEVIQLCKDCLPMPDPYFEVALPLMLKNFRPVVIASNFETVTPSFLEKCHQAGAIVIADETEPDPASWEKTISMGLDGIQTDAPQKLIEYLKHRKR